MVHVAACTAGRVSNKQILATQIGFIDDASIVLIEQAVYKNDGEVSPRRYRKFGSFSLDFYVEYLEKTNRLWS